MLFSMFLIMSIFNTISSNFHIVFNMFKKTILKIESGYFILEIFTMDYFILEFIKKQLVVGFKTVTYLLYSFMLSDLKKGFFMGAMFLMWGEIIPFFNNTPDLSWNKNYLGVSVESSDSENITNNLISYEFEVYSEGWKHFQDNMMELEETFFEESVFSYQGDKNSGDIDKFIKDNSMSNNFMIDLYWKLEEVPLNFSDIFLYKNSIVFQEVYENLEDTEFSEYVYETNISTKEFGIIFYNGHLFNFLSVENCLRYLKINGMTVVKSVTSKVLENESGVEEEMPNNCLIFLGYKIYSNYYSLYFSDFLSSSVKFVSFVFFVSEGELEGNFEGGYITKPNFEDMEIFSFGGSSFENSSLLISNSNLSKLMDKKEKSNKMYKHTRMEDMSMEEEILEENTL